VTIFTSNIPMDSLKLNERIVDRIFSMCIKLDLPEKSIRTMQAHDENMEFLKEVMKNAPDGAATPSQGK
jgi:DNA replication protein DnaC